MDQEKIGKLIAKLRKEKKLTQEQLGAKLGVNSKAVSKWECGVTTPDISIVNELSNILGITANELLTGKQDLNIKRYKNLLSCTSNFFKKNKVFMIIIALLFVVNILLCIYFFNNYPRTVRIPSAACIPSMSSGEVSRRTRITLSPAS